MMMLTSGRRKSNGPQLQPITRAERGATLEEKKAKNGQWVHESKRKEANSSATHFFYISVCGLRGANEA
jgi:hypothetical protein